MANNTGNPIGSTAAKDLSDNAENLDKFANGTDYEYADRLGRSRKSLKWIEDAALAIPAIDAAVRSEQQAERAISAKSDAEAARDAAQLSGGVYPDVAAGLASTPAGKFFSVPSPESSEYLILYQNAAGSPVEIKRYPSAEVLIGTKELIAELSANAGPYRNNEASMDDIEPLFAFTQKDQHGDSYNLLAFMPDSSIQSAPLKRFVSAEIGGMSMQDVELGGWGGYVFAQRDANGVLYAVSGVKDDGTQYLPGFDSGAAKGDLIHILKLGQSNDSADDAKPPLSISPTGWGALMFSRGIGTWSSADNPNTPESRTGFSLVPMVANGVETRANSMADAYKARLIGGSRFSVSKDSAEPDVLITSTSLGGRKLTELGPEDDGASGRIGARTPGGHWPTMLDDVARGVASAAAAGRVYRLPAWTYDQGESEGDMTMYYGGETLLPTALIASYSTKALAMAVQFDAQARALTGQRRPIPLFVTPATYNQYTPTAWLDVADASPLVFMVGPRYQMPSAKNASNGLAGASQNWGNEIHYAPDGQRWIGEMCAKVMHRVVNEGENWQPLRVLSASKVDATHIDLTFHVPRPPLIIDTELMPKAKGFGVTIYGGTIDAVVGPRISATAAELLPDGRTVRMTFPSIPTGALLSLGQSTCDLAPVVVASVGVGAPTAAGFATYTVQVSGDVRTTLKALTDEGAFWITALLPNGTPTALGVARGVTFDGTYTVITGETRELRTGGTYGPFASGDVLTLRRMNPYTNFRDSDNLLSLNTFATGPRAGKPYPLHNWACQYEAMKIKGA
ncbi:hypothetical protein [Pseudomonas sp. TMW22080]|uniref:hypothetical protein n=1 Tax=Pseudomonas sp. TMW22080 TaxID=2506432 RepID=UPI001F10D9E9|nr:hypothetical protein [Pseudomonas sp. TMW22080]MCH4885545.1 hypothetical protein [Pseudomonas sp. TMW22080]